MASEADKNPSLVEKNSMAVITSETVEKNSEGKKEKKKKKKNPQMLKFNKYIYNVMKKVNPDIGISREALKMMNSIISNTMMKIILEASSKNSRKTNEYEISVAVREIFPKEMAELAMSAERTINPDQDLELNNARGYTLKCSHYLPSPFPEDTSLPCVIYCHGNREALTLMCLI